jgi:hypothetical protein
MAEERQPLRVRLRVPLILLPYAAGVATAVPLWGQRADKIFFATAAEVIALGAVAMALEGRVFRLTAKHTRSGGMAQASVLIAVGVGLAFAFGALAREDGGAAPHLALTAGALAMGIAAFAVLALVGPPGVESED